MYRLIIVILVIFLMSCVPQTLPPVNIPVIAQPKPGIKLLLGEQVVWEEYNCSGKKLPLIVIEQDEILPSPVQPGQELRHHFIYAACTPNTLKAIKGSLSRKIYYRGHVIFQDTTRDFELSSGKWDVSAIIKIPPKARPGSYNFELTFSSPTTTVTKNLPFIVQK
jgi:hypothetical protein